MTIAKVKQQIDKRSVSAMPNTLDNNADVRAEAQRRRLRKMNLAEVCDLLRIDVATGRNRIALGQFPPHSKVGNELLFDDIDVERWILRRRNTDKAAKLES